MTVQHTDLDDDLGDGVDPEHMTLAQWEMFDSELKHELVEGVLIVSPPETYLNRRAAMRLALRLEGIDGVECTTDTGVTLDAHAPTVRCPDLVVARAGVGDVTALSAIDILLVAEVVAPSSRETDWVTKRGAYARAGIGNYLVVDRRRRRLVLFSEPVDGRYTQQSIGEPVALVFGEHTVELTLADLTD
ncbi:Uma2 family endonuclease [Mobilicoccus massiliensis]|uniref:Uma2 family endonuclease n=1 Tax=Mobilicoccus massiliensis TaxID=1522310 RepID=UPI000693EF10|nr:Uma2 family endonuclease [Mobilicoccus massiliensis]